MLERGIAKIVKEAERAALIAHVTPDGDTLGSVLALSLALDALGIPNDVFCEDVVPGLYKLLPGWQRIQLPPQHTPVYPLAISVDVSDHARLGGCARLFNAAEETIVLDHHMTNPGFGDHNAILERSATAEIILELIDLLEVELDGQIAENLYVAVTTDTGNFNYTNTTGGALRAAARLVETGIDVAAITRKVFRERTVAKTRLIGRAISSMRVVDEGTIALMCLTEEDFVSCGADDSDSEGIINYAIECIGVQVALLARQSDDGTKISFRSIGPVDVGTLASELGGGGHRTASGVTRPEPIEAAAEVALKAVREALGG